LEVKTKSNPTRNAGDRDGAASPARRAASLAAAGLLLGLAALASLTTTAEAKSRGSSRSHAAARMAPAAKPAGVRLLSVRSWSAPENTRVVFDFSVQVAPVVPDSGIASDMQIAVPGEPVDRASDVPGMVRVGDGVVDSVEVATGADGAHFRVFLHDSTFFRAFALSSEDDKPFRIVVDVTRRGGEAAEDQRLATIAASKRQDRVRIVVVDAGHGGEDSGARGPGGVREKDVTLGVAKRLADQLNQIPGIRALLTRSGDWFIPLRDRYRIAEKAKADVFLSIHCNSSRRRGSGNGTEVYFLSLRGASDQADADLANVENAADLVGGVPQHAEDDLVNILYDVKRSSALTKSQLLAESLLDQLSADRLEARGVKQAGFVVLKSVEFPSVLVETAFINNPREARMLKDPNFQKKLATQLAEGMKDYFQRAGIGLKPDSSSAGGGAN
jgi:N-acetylmuramoyl-L-alanine amidase